MHDDIKVDTGIAKCMEADGWRNLDLVIDSFDDGLGDLKCDPFDLLEVTIIGYANRNLARAIALRPAVVCDVSGCTLLV